MKNRDKDALYKSKGCTLTGFFFQVIKRRKNTAPRDRQGADNWELFYFTWYITSFTSLTVRGTSGKAAATRLGA